MPLYKVSSGARLTNISKMLTTQAMESEPLLTSQCLALIQTLVSLVVRQKIGFSFHLTSAQCPRCKLGIALNRTRSDQSQIVGFVV